MNKLEALADAITHYRGFLDPESESYRMRNPGMLRVYTLKHESNENAVRRFKSFLDGYQALLYDLKVKCSGKSRTRIKPESTLKDLMAVYGCYDLTAQYIAKFLRRALQDNGVTENTALSYFLEE